MNADTGNIREVVDELQDPEFEVEIDEEREPHQEAVDAFESHVREASLRLQALAVTRRPPVSPGMIRGRLAAQARRR